MAAWGASSPSGGTSPCGCERKGGGVKTLKEELLIPCEGVEGKLSSPLCDNDRA